MVRVRDAATGRLVALPKRGGVLGVCVHAERSGTQVSTTNLRLLLVADVLMRAVELTGVQVLTVLTGVRPDEAAELVAAADRWTIRPPVTVVAGGDPVSTLGAPVGAHIIGPTTTRTALDGVVLAVGPVVDHATSERIDPAAVRLALLSHRHDEPADLSAASAAESRLEMWRARVAEWAGSPSRPIPSRFRGRAEASLADDLDTAAVLSLLDDIDADRTVADGAKFETFAFLDRVLGLALTSAIGQGA